MDEREQLNQRLLFLGLLVSNLSFVELVTHRLVWLLMDVEDAVGRSVTSRMQMRPLTELGLTLLKQGVAQIPESRTAGAARLLERAQQLSDRRGQWAHGFHFEAGYVRVRDALAGGAQQLEDAFVPVDANAVWEAATDAKILGLEMSSFMVEVVEEQRDDLRTARETAMRAALSEAAERIEHAAE